MGCTTALVLAERGADVVVLERAVPGAEASSAAAGILGAQVELHGRTAQVETFVRARDGWRAWAETLREITGIDVGHRTSGVLKVARTEADLAELTDEVRWQESLGLNASLLDCPRAHEVEPELAADLAGASYFPDDAQVDPPALLRALMAALARSPRVIVRAGATVERLIVLGDRCAGVELDEGEVRADATVLPREAGPLSWRAFPRPYRRSAPCGARSSFSTSAPLVYARSFSEPGRTWFREATVESCAGRRWSTRASAKR
jgi:glycine oxidase